jgi:hypothetical protein
MFFSPIVRVFRQGVGEPDVAILGGHAEGDAWNGNMRLRGFSTASRYRFRAADG